MLSTENVLSLLLETLFLLCDDLRRSVRVFIVPAWIQYVELILFCAHWQEYSRSGTCLASYTHLSLTVWARRECPMLRRIRHKLLHRHFTARLLTLSVLQPTSRTLCFTIVMAWSSSNRYYHACSTRQDANVTRWHIPSYPGVEGFRLFHTVNHIAT